MDVISEINEKYSALEAEIDKRLEKIKADEKKLEKLQEQNGNQTAAQTTKSLEIAKARLRSRSTFSPVEQILEKAIANYKRDLETSQQLSSRFKQVQIYEASPAAGPDRENGDQE
ncbi:PREDICTED: uncharacterized protein LOC108379884 [Rhagoletis zephyria]|uniref:uncharacterized protein LOC108379884 n=1 Tax=Rhagoletis zephyria TaxID=28612 RepID=UPI000811999F|nr:PREDICTED: uncharacterized protein LOC108379884 [Rhagoletis zephyria]